MYPAFMRTVKNSAPKLRVTNVIEMRVWEKLQLHNVQFD